MKILLAILFTALLLFGLCAPDDVASTRGQSVMYETPTWRSQPNWARLRSFDLDLNTGWYVNWTLWESSEGDLILINGK